MKKLLSILGALGLVATSSSLVVSCGIGENDAQSLPAELQEQNFRALDLIGLKKETLTDLMKPEDFYISNGLDDDNKFVPMRSDSLAGSFDAGEFALINQINKAIKDKSIADNKGDKAKPVIELKKNFNPSFDDFANAKTYGAMETKLSDLSKDKRFIENYDELGKITLKEVTGEYKENGVQEPVSMGADEILNVYEKLINLGNTDWWNQQSDSNPDNKEAWQKQLAFIESSDFTNRDYKKTTTLEYEGTDIKLLQQIKLESIQALKASETKGRINDLIKSMKDKYTKLTAGIENLDASYEDKFLNLIFSKLNIFTAAKQEYGTAVTLNGNDIYKQLNDALNNAESLVSDAINKNNEAIVAKSLSDIILDSANNLPNVESNVSDKPLGAEHVGLKFDGLMTKQIDNSELKSNDFLYNNFLTKDSNQKTMEDFINNYQFDGHKLVEQKTKLDGDDGDGDTPATTTTYHYSYFTQSSSLMTEKKTVFDEKDTSDKETIFNKMVKNMNDTVFDQKKNVESKLTTSFRVYMSLIKQDEASSKQLTINFSTTALPYLLAK